MKASDKQLLYISGPSCAGKSTVSKDVLKEIRAIHYILGDEFWIQNEQYDFDRRIERTNQDIIAAIEKISAEKVLLEWVPSYGPFVDRIKSICLSKEYTFIHVVITAPKDILEMRKLARDGNKELGPVDLERYATLKNITLYDSSVESTDTIVSECIRILSS